MHGYPVLAGVFVYFNVVTVDTKKFYSHGYGGSSVRKRSSFIASEGGKGFAEGALSVGGGASFLKTFHNVKPPKLNKMVQHV